jgi:hypothetical protein
VRQRLPELLATIATVTGAWDEVTFKQERRRVTFTPGDAHHDIPAGGRFTFFFQVGDPAVVGKPEMCTVNDLPCAGVNA